MNRINRQVSRIFGAVGLLALLVSCQVSQQDELALKVNDHTAVILDSLIDLRRDLHQHPEVAGQEERTAGVITDYLEGLGLEVKTDIAGHGVIGVLSTGKSGKNIAWRSDMDALKMTHSDSSDFASVVEGVGHMCGHDLHTTIGLGIANVLTSLKADLSGTVYFIFQPSEETFKGAKAIAESELFHEMNLDEIFALHVFPSEIGSISTKEHELFAYEKTIKATLKKGIDEQAFKTYFQGLINSFVRSKEGSFPQSLDFLTDPELGLESPETIYKDYMILFSSVQTAETDTTVSFMSTFFETNRTKVDSILGEVELQLMGSDYQDNVVSIVYSRGNPTVDNDPKLLQDIQENMARLNIPPITLLYGQVPYFNEDFIYFQQKVPGVLFFLGASNTEKNIVAMPHTPDFSIDETAIKKGVNYFSTLILDRVKN